jgi:hypothetical protein
MIRMSASLAVACPALILGSSIGESPMKVLALLGAGLVIIRILFRKYFHIRRNIPAYSAIVEVSTSFAQGLTAPGTGATLP